MNEVERRAELVQELTGPKGDFAIGPVTVRGIEMPAYTRGPETIRDLVAAGAAWGDRPAVTYEDEKYTWAQQSEAIHRCAAALHHTVGVRQGDRIALAMRNYPEWIVAFHAIVSIGAVCVPLNAWWTGEELTYALADCEAPILIADRERTVSVQARRSELPVLRTVIEVRPGDVPRGDLEWSELLARECPPFDAERVPIGADDDATILYTSGTTGRPKGAVATHRAHITASLNARVHGIVEASLAQERGERSALPVEHPVFLVPGPLFHVSYLPRAIGAPLAGSHLVLMYKWDAARAVEVIEREEIEVLVAVPMVARQLLDELERRGEVPPSLQGLLTGGAQSTSALIGRIERQLGGSVGSGTGYGMTETCGPMIMIGSHDYFAHPLSVGRPTPAVRFRIVTALGADAQPGEVGEAWFGGPGIARGYWNQDSSAFTDDGWIRTGDLVVRDVDGFISIVDRIKDIVIRAGENVYCGEVEQVLADHPAIVDVAVLGLPHELWGEEVAAVVQSRPGERLTEQAVRDHVAGRLARFKVPTTLVVQDDPLPRNAGGKVLKAEIRSRLLAQHEVAVTPDEAIQPQQTGTAS